ncbi:MAG TPA: hypothetical protein VKP69_21915 [Isosphaeraceae bacterium]|nr:hypothetical protein [Isosphaeraceae bacterium]
MYVVNCAMHYRAHTTARRMVEGLTPVVNSYWRVQAGWTKLR